MSIFINRIDFVGIKIEGSFWLMYRGDLGFIEMFFDKRYLYLMINRIRFFFKKLMY